LTIESGEAHPCDEERQLICEGINIGK